MPNIYIEYAFCPLHNAQYVMETMFQIDVTWLNVKDYKETTQLLYIGKLVGNDATQLIPMITFREFCNSVVL